MSIYNLFNDCSNLMFYYIKQLVGTSNIYYRRFYNYLNYSNKYYIQKICYDEKEFESSFFFDLIPKNFDNYLDIQYMVNNKYYWVTFNHINDLKKNDFPIYDIIEQKAFSNSDEDITLVKFRFLKILILNYRSKN